MTSVVSPGWQSAKTLIECNIYMLKNQIECDVTFTFPTGSGESRKLKAHKYILISRSIVFEAMLCGNFQESSNEVEITDIDPDIFMEILMYMYSDQVKLTEVNVMAVFFGAKKYLLDHLMEECRTYLMEVIGVKNVCTILNHCILYDEEKMIQTCVEFVASHAKQVLLCKDFLQSSKPTLKKILQIQTAFAPEIKILKACIKWAKHNKASGQTLRDTLGDCIYDIRFMMIDTKDLTATLYGNCNILTDSEQLQFLRQQINPKHNANSIAEAGFNITPRTTWGIVNRFQTTSSRSEWHTGNKFDMIGFSVTEPILLHGIAVYGCGKKGTRQRVEVRVIYDEIDDIVRKTEQTFISSGTNEPVAIMFDSPAPISNNDKLVLRIAVKIQGPYTYCGYSGRESVEVKDDVIFKFLSCGNSNGTDIVQGQIPQLFYTYIPLF